MLTPFTYEGYRIEVDIQPTEDLIASWLTISPIGAETSSDDREVACISCGYAGPMDDRACPVCRCRWQDREGMIRRALCPECGQAIALTEHDRGKTTLCPRCRSLLGILINREEGTRRQITGSEIAIFFVLIVTSVLLVCHLAS